MVFEYPRSRSIRGRRQRQRWAMVVILLLAFAGVVALLLHIR
jgi:hypothetical protein